jgi:hypothetical protein
MKKENDTVTTEPLMARWGEVPLVGQLKRGSPLGLYCTKNLVLNKYQLIIHQDILSQTSFSIDKS